MALYHVSLTMQDEVHVQVEANEPHEAARKAFEMAEQWANQTEPLEDVWTGPEQPSFDGEARVTETLDGGPPYWSEPVYLEVFEGMEDGS